MFIVVDGAINIDNSVIDEGKVIDSVSEDIPTTFKDQMNAWGKVVIIDPFTEEGEMYIRSNTLLLSVQNTLQTVGFFEEQVEASEEQPQDTSSGAAGEEEDKEEEEDPIEEQNEDVNIDNEGYDDVVRPKKNKAKKTRKKKTSKQE